MVNIIRKRTILETLSVYGELHGLTFRNIGVIILQNMPEEELLTNLVDFSRLKIILEELEENREIEEIWLNGRNKYRITNYGRETITNYK